MRLVLILRGAPGSGKTHLASIFQSSPLDVVVVSADRYMVNESGDYEFNHEHLGLAHQKCKEEFRDALEYNRSMIIVDNTNANPLDFVFYEQKALAAGYSVHTVICENRHGGVSTHDVPESTTQRMRDKIRLTARL